jgi:hypothetical protein
MSEFKADDVIVDCFNNSYWVKSDEGNFYYVVDGSGLTHKLSKPLIQNFKQIYRGGLLFWDIRKDLDEQTDCRDKL